MSAIIHSSVDRPAVGAPPGRRTAPSPLGARARALAGTILGCLAAPTFSFAAANTVLNSKHDLSATGPGPIKATSETEVCVFCHTPHHSLDQLPLWNHALSTATYTPYSSSTIKATIGQPTGASKLCLSCHDGTVALGQVKRPNSGITLQNSVTTMPAGPSNLGTDLSKDHPISFTYDGPLASADPRLKDPSTLTGKVRLDSNKQVQCTSCHDPHNDQFGNFLVCDSAGSALCLYCHTLTGWSASTHATSSKTWNGVGVDPWTTTNKGSVAAHGCDNCHAAHGAGSKTRLLHFAADEKNCLSCHSGSLALKNIGAELNKTSSHPIYATSGAHDPAENVINPGTRHAACADCHEPHSTTATAAVAPKAAGSILGAKGVSAGGAILSAVTREYELCFRCHADSTTRGPATVSRQISGNNARLQFNTANASYHPVVASGPNPSVPSLLAPYTAASVIFCTDCHNNDQGPRAGGSGPNGPHGSIYPPLLERRLTLTDYQPESAANYALCYKCHSRNSLLADDSFKAVNSQGQERGHRFHVVDQQTACTTCHDSHGVVTAKHLINFNTVYVRPSSNGRLEYVSAGPGAGNCSLTCHGKDHSATRYPFPNPARSSAVAGKP